jgi:hypothetical protein
MSSLGQKQTSVPRKVMSALTLKTDMCGATRDVRCGPKADNGLRCADSYSDLGTIVWIFLFRLAQHTEDFFKLRTHRHVQHLPCR